ncbi:unnamed protein product [Penicillium salamii]|uniref:MYND-type domain-containing protein n=1 Tax=Penicillium salamii TaxID=1612424 RepID=A0A9W4JR83_9EURO|nr:unnamed protein product [Penicillium salamii]CAG8395381.1 unnamed protein product [Penicillium salamii]CAG8414548.1 unnamed protein product [Penicillium salamii]CAG8419791.1 unnamed protein product [Penicillium salamii]
MVTTEMPSGCSICRKKEGLLVCSGCKVLPYCNRDHQIADRPAHKSACSAIRRARVKMEKEEQILRNHPGNIMMSADPFTNSVGHFWGVLETRDYMRARLTLVRAMEDVNHSQSAEARLNHFMDMLRLCRSDNMGVRDIVPGLMLRLNKDQECYDFIRWWQVVNEDSRYDWGNIDLPYLDVKNADVFEPVKAFCGNFPDLSHLTCLCLLKIKLLFEVMRLQQSTASLGLVFPREILDLIQLSVPRSSVVRASHDIMFGDSDVREAIIDKLKVQINIIFSAVEKANEHFWPALIDPYIDLTENPQFYSAGSVEEMLLVLQYNRDAWLETPGAIDFIKVKVNGGF